MLGMNDVSDDINQQNELIWDSIHAQQGLGVNDTFIFESDLLDLSSWLPTPAVSDQSVDNVVMIDASSSVIPGERLVTLIARMQNCLQILEGRSWGDDSEDNMDDYPVGTVLHLSQEFGSIASLILSRGCVLGTITPREYISAGENDTDADGNGHVIKPREIDSGSDTITTLLVLSGYMSLTRIYSLVLGQFQTHISSLNSNHTPSNGVQTASTNPTLQLGELPCTSAAPVLGKIHTALRMLLTALHGVEEKLGPGGAVARNLVLAQLAQEAVVGISEIGGLSRKMISMKEVLREKMNM